MRKVNNSFHIYFPLSNHQLYETTECPVPEKRDSTSKIKVTMYHFHLFYLARDSSNTA